MALFAIVPAAGLSRRMGQPKLVMDLAGKTVIERLLTTLSHPAITETVVVFRQGDSDLSEALSSLPFSGVNPSSRIYTVQPEVDPPDMRTSVEYGLEAVRSRHSPQPDDGWLLIPADHPVLDHDVLAELIEAWQTTDEEILIPRHGGKSGHPTFFRWSTANRLAEMPDDKGLNWLRTAPGIRVRELPVSSDSILLDLDTPEDYQRILLRAESTDRRTDQP
jgi:molybdenum cofactor cytidylyltransferase